MSEKFEWANFFDTQNDIKSIISDMKSVTEKFHSEMQVLVPQG